MKLLVRTALSVVAVTLIASNVALAKLDQVPEVDPAMGALALVFLGGAIMVIRGRTKA
jgi:hypothetical protein